MHTGTLSILNERLSIVSLFVRRDMSGRWCKNCAFRLSSLQSVSIHLSRDASDGDCIGFLGAIQGNKYIIHCFNV